MIDRFLAPVLTFVTLIAATAGFGSALLYSPGSEAVLAQPTPTEIIVLETVTITAQREQPQARLADGRKNAPAAASHAAEGRGFLLQRTRE